MVTFLDIILNSSRAGRDTAENDAIRILKRAIGDIATNFNVKLIETCRDYDAGSHSISKFSEATASILRHCLRLNLSTEAGEIIGKLIKDASAAKKIVFESYHLPLLKKLAELLKEYELSADESVVQLLFQHNLGHFVVQFVGLKPENPLDWTKSFGRTRWCAVLNAFSSAPTEKSWEFKGSVRSRNHLGSQLRYDPEFRLQEDEETKTLKVIKRHYKYQSNYKLWKQTRDTFTMYMEEFSGRLLMSFLGDWYWPIMEADVKYVAAALEHGDNIQKLAALEIKDGAPRIQVEDLDSDDDEDGEEENFHHF